MKKLLTSALVVAAATTALIGGTKAYFSDTETSVDNTFVAGRIDLTIDNNGYYNGVLQDGTGSTVDLTWGAKDLTTGDKFFNFSDVKPGDYGRDIMSVHVSDNPAWVCMAISPIVSQENTLYQPESDAGDTTNTVGELQNEVNFFAWLDDGDDVYEAGEAPLFSSVYGSAADVLSGTTYALADAMTGAPWTAWTAGETKYIGLQWCFGDMTVDQTTGTITCDGSTVGNDAQSDSFTADLKFYAEQTRHNDSFNCSSWTPVW